MIPDGTYTAVVDEVERELARLELETVDGELYGTVVEVSELPPEGRHESAVLSVRLVDEEVVEAEYDEAEEQHRREAAQARFDRLSQRPPSQDKKNDE